MIRTSVGESANQRFLELRLATQAHTGERCDYWYKNDSPCLLRAPLCHEALPQDRVGDLIQFVRTKERPKQKMASEHSSTRTIDAEPNSVLVSTSGDGITTITINRQKKRNAVDGPTAKKLTDAFLAFEDDSTQKVCVFYGAHGTFCAGFDLREVAKLGSGDKEVGENPNDRVVGRNIGPMGPSRMQIKKPVISAVSGYAVAGGLELSLLGDIRVAEEDAIFGVFCRRWGAPLIDGGTVRLQAIIGLGRALDLILTGRGVGAREALMMGLANRVVPTGKALEEATQIARQLLLFPQACMNIDRENCYYSVYNAKSFEDALSREFDEGSKVVTKETIAGASKFSSGAGRHGIFQVEKPDTRAKLV